MKLTKKIALVSASLALGLATPAVLAAENAGVTLAATQVTAVTVTKKTAPYYHKDGSKFTKAKPYKYGRYSSATTGKGANYKVIKTVTIKGAKYYYIGNDAYLKASDVKVTASKKVKAVSSKKTSTKTAKKTSTKTAKKTTSTKTAKKTTSTNTAKKTASTKSAETTKKTASTKSAKTTKKTASTKSAKTTKKTASTKSAETTKKTASTKSAKTTKKTASTKSAKTTKKTASTKSTKTTKKAAKTVVKVKVAKKTVPFYHKDGSKYTNKKPYVYAGWKSAVAYKNVKYKVVKTVTIKGAKYYYIGNDAYLKAADVTVTKTK